ncbi:DUF6495 family protein [Flavobacteriales bacterium]|nr:DUF6495 family protein [Flavobacteriales bacterium]
MKYRRLTIDELKELEQEFIQFLISNGIESNDWEKIKKDTPKEADILVDTFSDVVQQKVLEGVRYLEYRAKNEARYFECNAEEIKLIALTSRDVDLLDVAAIKRAVHNSVRGIEIYSGVKKYAKQRELELFNMIQSGCEITDEKLFLLLHNML